MRDTLQALRGKRTLVIVSHRISTVKDCDVICVLEEGKFKETGTHSELLQKKGLYHRLAWSPNGSVPVAA